MQKIIRFFILIGLFACASPVWGQLNGIFSDEPTVRELGAPFYPGAVFIRKISGLDPYYETAMYISFVPMKLVEDFFKRNLLEKRAIYYDDDDINLTAYLLKTWSRFPGKPTRDDIDRLQSEPTVQIRSYDPTLYEPLAKYFDGLSDGKLRSQAVRNGKTVLLYTYEKSEENKSARRILGTWREASRDLGAYSSCTLEFSADSTYTLTFTPDNLAALSRLPSVASLFPGKSPEEISRHLESINPETGTYFIIKNTITMRTENPIDGGKIKSGLADAGQATMSMELIDRPRLTFVKMSFK